MKQEAPEINVGISILQVKQKDLVVQDAIALVMIENKKTEHLIPFDKDMKYKFDSLLKNFVFKFAILQNDEILGVLYLEIPYKYKFTKKFKVDFGLIEIDDWYPVKPFDKQSTAAADCTIIARVVINYEANCKLDPTDYASVAELSEQKDQSNRGDFLTRMKKISKMATAGDKENTNYLEEVEKNILNRRKPGLNNSTEKNKNNLNFQSNNGRSSSRQKGILSKSTTKKLPLGTSVTPDSLYNTQLSQRDTKKAGDLAESQLVQKMANELNLSRQEAKDLRKKLSALEDGQMTVDNAQLAKTLDEERRALNNERMALLKNMATKEDEIADDRRRLAELQAKIDNDNREAKQALEEEKKEVAQKRHSLDSGLDDLRTKESALNEQANRQNAVQKSIGEREAAIIQAQTDLADYKIELEELKDRLLKERDRLQHDRAKAEGERANLEQEIKSLRNMKEGLEKEREKELKEVTKRKREVDMEEEKVKREAEKLKNEDERLKRDRFKLEEELNKYKKLNDEIEEEKLKLWKDRNTLNNEIKQFIDDRKNMDNEMKWRQKELEQIDEELQEEVKQLDNERQELEELEQELENKQNDLETRENLLLIEREDFNKLKLKFMDGLIESGGLAYLTPELKQMAKSMGIEIDEMEKERGKIDARRKELERLQKQHEDDLKALNAKASSKASSRRGSISQGFSQRRASIALGLKPGLLAGKTFVNTKLTVEGYLNDLYDTATTQYTIKQLKENRATIDRLLEEKDFAQKLIEQLRNENKALKKDFDLLAKVIDQYRAEGLNIDVATILGKQKPRDVSTNTEDNIFDEEKEELLKRIQELELKLKRGQFERSGTGTGSELDDEDFNSKLFEVQEQLKNLLKQISEEQEEYERRGLPEISNRIMNIHYLVYSFMQDIIQFLIRFNKPRDKLQREMFAKILSFVSLQKPAEPSNLELGKRAPGIDVPSAEAQDVIRKLNQRIQELEERNITLKDLVENLKSTFDFFEIANDQYILQRH